jgi:hypothetical protein
MEVRPAISYLQVRYIFILPVDARVIAVVEYDHPDANSHDNDGKEYRPKGRIEHVSA